MNDYSNGLISNHINSGKPFLSFRFYAFELGLFKNIMTFKKIVYVIYLHIQMIIGIHTHEKKIFHFKI